MTWKSKNHFLWEMKNLDDLFGIVLKVEIIALFHFVVTIFLIKLKRSKFQSHLSNISLSINEKLATHRSPYEWPLEA